MTIEAVREHVTRLTTSVGALVAMGLVIDERLSGVKLEPAIKREASTLLGILGVQSALDTVKNEALRPVLADIRASVLQSTKALGNVDAAGWRHTEADILRTQGEISAAFPVMWKEKVVPRLEGLQHRLEAERAAFLDVGVGIAALAISAAKLWPAARVVGIDIWRPSLDIAHENIKRAGLSDRIELREQAVEMLSDRDVFDLAWLPVSFMPTNIVPAAVNRIREALRPGGWLLFNTTNPDADPVTSCFVRLRTLLWGGTSMVPEEAESLLNKSGYRDVQRLPSAPSAPMAMVAGRRP